MYHELNIFIKLHKLHLYRVTLGKDHLPWMVVYYLEIKHLPCPQFDIDGIDMTFS